MTTKDKVSEYPNYEEALKCLVTKGLGSEKVLQQYADMGTDYDKFCRTIKYSGHTKMREVVASILKDNYNAKILDVGAGTGLAGIELKEAGYTNIDAVEPVQHLVDVCNERKIYKNVICQLLGGDERLPIQNDTYDMIVLAGVLVENHMPLDAFEELTRITRPGGYIINTCREEVVRMPWYKDFDVYMKKLEKEGKWKEFSRQTYPNYLDNVLGMVLIHQVL